MKVTQYKNKNQFIITGDGVVCFQSYDSMIAEYDTTAKRLAVGSHWDYSQTTSKHFYLWLAEFVGVELTSTNKRQEFAKIIDNEHTHNTQGERISVEHWTQSTMDENNATKQGEGNV